MNAIATSFAWLFSQRHVVALSSAVGVLIVIAVWLRYCPDETVPIGIAILFSAMPIIFSTYTLTIFAFGSDSDLLSPISTYPTHLIRLPMSSISLVAYPFGLGTIFITVYWAATCWGVLLPLAELRDQDWFGPPKIITPLVWLSTLAWVQAVLWSNHRSLITRSANTLAALTLPLILGSRWWTPNLSDEWVAGGLLISIPAGIGLAVANLNLVRQGHPEGWLSHCFRAGEETRHGATIPMPTEQDDGLSVLNRGKEAFLFRHPVRAQAWCDWRRYCLPITIATVGAMLFFMSLGILWPTARQARVTILFLPPVIGCFAGFGIGGLHERTSDSGVPVFLASLPLTTAQFITAKWIATSVCAAFSCLTAVGMFSVATLIAGDSVLVDAWRWLRQEFPAAQLFFGAIVSLAFYALLTWILLIQAIPIKLSGRHWLHGFCMVSLAAVILFAVVVTSLENATLLPWSLAIVVAIKSFSAWWTLGRIRRLELVERETLIHVTQFWCLIVVLCIFTLFGFLLPFQPSLIAPLAIAMVLFAPISRLAMAPLALHWNRHR